MKCAVVKRSSCWRLLGVGAVNAEVEFLGVERTGLLACDRTEAMT